MSAPNALRDHLCEAVEETDEGFFFGVCTCGHETIPVPDFDLVVDEMMAHAVSVSVCSAPELLFLEDGGTLAWSAQDGSLFLAVTDAAESHEHRVVLEVPDIAAMLHAAMRSEPTPWLRRGTTTRVLEQMLREYLSRVDALTADAR